MTDTMHLLFFPEHPEGVHYALAEAKRDLPNERFRGSRNIRYWQLVARVEEN